MSKKADCWDNAVSESFFKTLKTEWLYHVDLIDLDHAERELFEYIEMFYNNQRLHAYLDYVSPALFERLSLAESGLNHCPLFPGHITLMIWCNTDSRNINPPYPRAFSSEDWIRIWGVP